MEILSLHSWNISPEEAYSLQKRLADKVVLDTRGGSIEIVAGVDTAFDLENGECIAGVIVFRFPGMDIIERQNYRRKIEFPYIPGLLTFREGPAVLGAIEKLHIKPDVFFFDGQGIAHPRRMGIATHIGLFLNLPTIGCAKSRLCGAYKEPLNTRGHFTYLKDGNEIIGAAVRTRKDVKPVFISPGYKISISMAIGICLRCTYGFRIPEPTRQAHIYVEKLKRKKG